MRIISTQFQPIALYQGMFFGDGARPSPRLFVDE